MEILPLLQPSMPMCNKDERSGFRGPTNAGPLVASSHLCERRDRWPLGRPPNNNNSLEQMDSDDDDSHTES